MQGANEISADMGTCLQLWGSIAEHLTQRKADLVLLVHRLEDPAPDRVARSVPCTSNVMTGITSAPQPSCSMESFEELLRTGTAHAEYSGKVGDCCDEEVVSQVCDSFPLTSACFRAMVAATRVPFQPLEGKGRKSAACLCNQGEGWWRGRNGLFMWE